jgi:hypothetical protein
MILLRGLKGAMRLDRSKDMAMKVSTCTCFAYTTHVFLRLVAEMRDRIFGHELTLKFCVKLGKKANDTCSLLSEAYEGEVMKKSSVSEYHKRFKVSLHVEITNEDNAHHFL